MPDSPPVSVVETAEFIARIDRLLGEAEQQALIDYLARNPTEGDVIKGTGGVRKLRWRLSGRGNGAAHG